MGRAKGNMMSPRKVTLKAVLRIRMPGSGMEKHPGSVTLFKRRLLFDKYDFFSLGSRSNISQRSSKTCDCGVFDSPVSSTPVIFDSVVTPCMSLGQLQIPRSILNINNILAN